VVSNGRGGFNIGRWSFTSVTWGKYSLQAGAGVSFVRRMIS